MDESDETNNSTVAVETDINNNVHITEDHSSNQDMQNDLDSELPVALPRVLATPKKSTEDIWKKHLHFPTIEAKTKKRNICKVPLAVTSKTWKEYYEKKKNQKKNFGGSKEKRRIARENIKKKKISDKEKKKSNNKRRKLEHHSSTSLDQQSDDESMNDNDGKEKDRDNNKKKKISGKEKKSNNKRRKLECDSSTTSDEQSDAVSMNDDEDTENYVNGISDEESDSSAEMKPKSNRGMTVADFVIVEYEGQHFPGVIIKKRKSEYEVRAMHKSGPQTCEIGSYVT